MGTEKAHFKIVDKKRKVLPFKYLINKCKPTIHIHKTNYTCHVQADVIVVRLIAS